MSQEWYENFSGAGADTDLENWSDFELAHSGSSVFTVKTAAYVQGESALGTTGLWKYNPTGGPTERYALQVDCYFDSAVSGAGEAIAGVRIQGVAVTGYLLVVTPTTWELRRTVSDSGTVLASGTHSLAEDTYHTLRLYCDGTNPVRLLASINNVAVAYYEDTDGARLTSGLAGIGYWSQNSTPGPSGANRVRMDSFDLFVSNNDQISFDPFTVGADTYLESYGDWNALQDLSSDAQILNVDDFVHNATVDGARHIGQYDPAGGPAGDYEFYINFYIDDTSGFGEMLIAVHAPSGAGFYVITIRVGTTGNVRIQRDVGGLTTLDTGDYTIAAATWYRAKVSVSGTNPVNINVYINGSAAICTAADSNAARIVSGQAGAGYYAETGGIVRFDIAEIRWQSSSGKPINAGLINAGLINGGLI